MNSEAERLRGLVVEKIFKIKKPMAREPPNKVHCKMTIGTHSISRKTLMTPSDHRNQYSGWKSDKNDLLNMENKDIGVLHSGSDASAHNYHHKFAEH